MMAEPYVDPMSQMLKISLNRLEEMSGSAVVRLDIDVPQEVRDGAILRTTTIGAADIPFLECDACYHSASHLPGERCQCYTWEDHHQWIRYRYSRHF